MFCPEVSSDCIQAECFAYKVTMHYKYCSICDIHFKLGTRCNCADKANARIRFSGVDAVCKHYDIKFPLIDKL